MPQCRRRIGLRLGPFGGGREQGVALGLGWGAAFGPACEEGVALGLGWGAAFGPACGEGVALGLGWAAAFGPLLDDLGGMVRFLSCLRDELGGATAT